MRSGNILLLGPTNSGKSTLLNQIVGKKVSMVSRKQQSTTFNQKAVKSISEAEFILSDTPGIFSSSKRISNKTYEFVGPICESTDKFNTLKNFQELKENDLITICDVGAYGMSLSSNYNVRLKAPEILIKGSKIKVIRKKQKYKDLM